LSAAVFSLSVFGVSENAAYTCSSRSTAIPTPWKDFILLTAEHFHPPCSAKLNEKICHSSIHFEQWGELEKLPIDFVTGSIWNVRIGIAKGGPLKGQDSQPVPSLTSFD
jgi:hypothetical protein